MMLLCDAPTTSNGDDPALARCRLRRGGDDCGTHDRGAIERAISISALLALCGFAMAIAGLRRPVRGPRRHRAAVRGSAVSALVMSQYLAPEPSEARLSRYYDEPTKVGIVLVAGMGRGRHVLRRLGRGAAGLAGPDLRRRLGELRPHPPGPHHRRNLRLRRQRADRHLLPRACSARRGRACRTSSARWFVLIGYNLFCVLAATGYLMGITQSKEYAEPEWYADIWLVIVWVIYFLIYIRTLQRRKEPHIYVANWYYMAFILVVAVLHIVNNLAVPVSFGEAKSYSLFSGVQDAMTQWWYGHNAVAFFLTAGFLGMMYYYLPKRAGRPIFSYRLSIISFWGITFMYMWAGSHHLHYTALPQWVQTLGMTFSVVLLVPSWASAGNALATLNGAWHKVRDDATLRFMMVAAVFYGLSTFEGSFMAIRAVNSLSHYTDWTVGHVHAGALGWVAMITFGSFYALVPWMWKQRAHVFRAGWSRCTSGSPSRVPSSTSSRCGTRASSRA